MTRLKLSTLSTEEKSQFAERLSQCWPAYEFEDDQAYYESLSLHDFHDPEELHEMRQQSRYVAETCRVKMSTTDVREGVRIARAGFSQAPPRWVSSVANDVGVLVRRAA